MLWVHLLTRDTWKWVYFSLLISIHLYLDTFQHGASHIHTEPLFVSISHTHIVAASKTAFYVWYYRTPSRLAAPELTHVTSRKGREGQDRLIHADDHPTGASPPTVDFKKANIVSDKRQHTPAYAQSVIPVQVVFRPFLVIYVHMHIYSPHKMKFVPSAVPTKCWLP